MALEVSVDSVDFPTVVCIDDAVTHIELFAHEAREMAAELIERADYIENDYRERNT